ncbi:MAG: hypothetical protein RLZZ206_1084 [Cyanobacteriota bacterium]|jgi:hypothetical protein
MVSFLSSRRPLADRNSSPPCHAGDAQAPEVEVGDASWIEPQSVRLDFVIKPQMRARATLFGTGRP